MGKVKIHHQDMRIPSKAFLYIKNSLCSLRAQVFSYYAFNAMLFLIFYVVLFNLLLISHALAEDDSPQLEKGKKELQDIRIEINEKKKGLADAGKKEKGILAEIEKIDRRLHAMESEERKLDREIILLEKGLREKTASISALNLEVERKKKLLQKRLVFLYKTGEAGYLKLLLSSEGLTDSTRKYRYLVSIAAHDRELIKDYRRDAANLSRQMEGIRADKEKLELVEKELATKRVEIKKERGERDRILASVREDKHRYKESLKELEANARSLQNLLERLERKGSKESIKSYPAGGFEHQKGLLDFPVKGEVTGFFGKELDERHITKVSRKGIDIRASGGSAIRAVYNGRVIFASQFKGYGLMMVVDHGGGYYTVYAHAAKLFKKVNDEIIKGDIIGEMGGAGQTGEPILYFEVRKGGKPEDPLNWLKS